MLYEDGNLVAAISVSLLEDIWTTEVQRDVLVCFSWEELLLIVEFVAGVFFTRLGFGLQ